jgi:hypothetical protein
MMMHFLRATFLLLALVKRGQSQSASLATPFDGKPDNENASDGDKFTITTKDSAIMLERFDIHMMNKTATIEIYTRTGCKNVTNAFPPRQTSFVCGYPQDTVSDTDDGIAYDWTRRYSDTITGLGLNVSTPMPAINLYVPANTTLGVYITSTTYNGKHIYHTLGPSYFSYNGPSPGLPTPSFASDNYISIHEGISEKGSHSYDNYIYPTRWNGKWIECGQKFNDV